jgi:hypothetical protein
MSRAVQRRSTNLPGLICTSPTTTVRALIGVEGGFNAGDAGVRYESLSQRFLLLDRKQQNIAQAQPEFAYIETANAAGSGTFT